MNFINIFKKSVAEYSNAVALADNNGKRLTTYLELDELSSRVAGKLHSFGYKKGDFILINMGRQAEYIAAYLGILKAGCIAVPTVPEYPKDRIDFISGNCCAKTIITSNFFDDIEIYKPFENLADDTEPALLIYTSGSTGTPKGIMHSCGDVARAAVRHEIIFENVSPIIYASLAPMSFIAHIFEFLTVLYLGGTTHILSNHTRKNVTELSKYYEKHNISMGWILASMLKVFDNKDKNLQCVICGSERVSQVEPSTFDILNLYGQSETVAIISMFKLDKKYDNTPVGKALPGFELLICDENGNILPQGSEGEICIKGKFDSYYFKNEEMTAATMEKTADGLTVIHTGDIGYINENGDAIYVNRKDWMVKINGQRVETFEIETLLLNMPEISNAAVKAFEDVNSQTYLAAYYVLNESIDEAEIRNRLKRKLPDYMIPRFFVKMKELPKTVNGKLDRKSLLAPNAASYKEKYIAPQNDIQKKICDAFEKVLSCGKVGINDDFFALGGDSIKVLSLIREAEPYILTPDTVLSFKTPALIAKNCEQNTEFIIPHNNEIPKVCPLTEAQRGVYLECTEYPDSAMYNIPIICRLPENTDIEKFIFAVKETAKMHKAFNVTIKAPDGIASMIYEEKEITVKITQTDDLDRYCKEFVKPFDFENGPLYRFEILNSQDTYYFLFDVHHIIFDGTSTEAFISEIARAYNSLEVFEEKLNIFDISAYEQGLKETEKYKTAQAFFEKKFSGVDFDSKPVDDFVLTDKISGAGRIVLYSESKFDSSDVITFTKKHKITENTLFLGAFAYALAKFGGADNSAFCTVNNGRHDARLSSSVGMFVKTLPLCYSFDEKMKISDYLSAVQSDFHDTIKNDCISFGELAGQYGVNTDVVFIYQADIFSGEALENGEITVDTLETGDSQSLLDVMLIKDKNSYRLMAHYKKSHYTKSLIESFSYMYLNIIKEMLTAKRLEDIELTDINSRAILDEFNATEYPIQSENTVVDLFRRQAKATPDNICLVYCDKKYTYSEIDRITDILAQHLLECGINKEDKVGILIPRNENMLICSLGVLKSGGAYLPLDPTYPPERLNLMVNDSGAKMLIYDPTLDNVISSDFKGIRMSSKEIKDLKPTSARLPKTEPNDLFVMLYTSGSTGTPKGVMFEHSNAFVTTEWVKKYFKMDETSKVTAYASYGFDAHTFDIYPAITSGAELHIISEDIRLDFLRLRDYFNDNKITHTVMTTQIGRQFALMGGLKYLRHLSVAGEKLTPLPLPESFSFYNLYGPTEGSVITSSFKLEENYKDVPVGKAVDNLKLYIVDKNNKLLPAGAVGELCIAGPHVTRGYLNRPDKTAEAYIENPFTSQKGYERIYKTGDIVRLMTDGNLQFVGRRDAQVKVRGFRVELTEIEEVIRRFNGIEDATVAAFDDPAGGKFIVAYVVSKQTISAEELAEFIGSEKPPYMVPAVIMQIDSIPLNQNGKVKKAALPVPKREVGKIIAPKNSFQKKIFDVIAKVIGHNEFGITTDIYTAGLTSIGAVKLNVELADTFGISIRIADIKANSTVKKLEKFINSALPQKSYDILEDYPITQTQNGIFVESISMPDSTVYNIPVLVKLSENVDTVKLCKAVTEVINAHPYVKTTLFTNDNGDIRAKRDDSLPVNIEVKECDTLPDISMLVYPFELIRSPLYRVAIYKTKDGNYLFMDFHHIICDGTSETVIFRDIDRAYQGENLEKEVFSGFEAALDEQAVSESDKYASAKEYWKNLLYGCETECMPKIEPESERKEAGNIIINSKNDISPIISFCKENGFTLNAYMNAVFSFVLSRFTGKDSISYSTIYNGRNDSRLKNSVLMSVKTLPVIANFKEDTTVKQVIDSIKEQLLCGMSNDICSFAELSHDYGVKSDILFIYQGDDFKFDSLCGYPAEIADISSKTAKAPISINVFLEKGCFKYSVEYRKDLYNMDFCKCLIDSVEETAKAFIKDTYIKNISFVSEKSNRIYEILNASSTVTDDVFCHSMIENIALKNPDKTAVIAAGEELTYKELNEKANIVAHNLLKLNVGTDNIIGLVLDRTKEVMITEIAILKAGGAFLPMIPSYPDERIDYCLTNAESPFVITTKEIKEQRTELFAENKPYKTLLIEELLKGDKKENPNISISENQLAYCIYTSGSTGTPKGVMIEHHSFRNFVKTNRISLKYYEGDFDGKALALSSISFDMSLFELFIPLCFGKTLYISSEEEFHNPALMNKLILNNNIQMMVCTPSFMNNMVSMPQFNEAFKKLVTVVVGAEAFPACLYDTLKEINKDLQIINGYGPTETSVCCSVKELNSSKGITIGRPTGNVKFYVTDKFGHILPPYAVGELIICGEGVSRGYVKLPEKNKASFFTLNGLPAYHSGDCVRLNASSEIDFSGRIDNQVKLRGFRVELDEIEKVMCEFEAVKQSKVIVRNNGTEDYLAGFFTAEKKIDENALASFMKSKLTYYMVPAVLMQIESMPLTPNGKIDKNGFPNVSKVTERKSGKKAPKKSLEQRLCEIFASVLNTEEIYADDNFFELGGTSLTASKVTMILMSENIEVKYGDIFDNPTPEQLAEFIEQRNSTLITAESKIGKTDKSITRDALKYNTVKYAHEVKRENLGDVLLTGAVGFLGTHILKELLDTESGHIYCLVRKGSHETAEIRLKTMLIYYFSNGFDEEMQSRITVIDADITDVSLKDTLKNVPFDTVINCAACVKHFSDNDILNQINVHGVENLIEVCKAKNAKMIQISTVSVPGIHTEESYEKQIRMHENELFVIDDMDNKYAISKYKAELKMFDAIESGMKGKVIRVGNLMGRYSDGEFQANMETNMFMSGIRGFAIMGKYPISHMTDPMRFSPVDCTAKAVVLLSGTNDKFTAFNADNRYGFDEMKIIDACNQNGITILPYDDEEYYREFKQKLGDDSINAKLNGLAAYDVKDAHAVDTDNLFTTNILYRIGFSWPLVDNSYLERAINSVMTLDYFDVSNGTEEVE